MKFIAQINIMPQKALLDPQGKAVLNGANKNGFTEVLNVRIGKSVEVEIDTDDEKKAVEIVDNLCEKILINPIIEYYNFNLVKCL